MPRIVEHTPSWLARPSPGFHLFSNLPKDRAQSASRPKVDASSVSSIRRLMVTRGSHVFLVVDNQLRWADLATVKNHRKAYNFETMFRRVKVPIKEPITSLSVSPLGEFLAIFTAQSAYIAFIYDHYDNDDGFPLKLKTLQLGPSEHVSGGASIVCALWHPLGVNGGCLVTITNDAVLRLWELMRDDRSSFDSSTLSIDLKKLFAAESDSAALAASTYGYGKAFSSDSAYLEPAAAAFGALGRPGESPWSSMTLWIAMVDGGVFALSPLLPQRFQAYPGLMRTLSTMLDIQIKEESGLEEIPTNLHHKKLWIHNLEKQVPLLVSVPSYSAPAEIYARPSEFRAEPVLQGPFGLGDDDIDIVALFVRNVSVADEPIVLDTGEVLLDDDEDDFPLSVNVVCLLDSANVAHVLLDLDGVEPQWLPSPSEQSYTDFSDLVRLGSLPLSKSLKKMISGSPTKMPSALITPDPRDSYSFWVTHHQGVTHFSFEALADRLKEELDYPNEAGLSIRANLSLTSNVQKQTLVRFDQSQGHAVEPILACVTILSEDLGYFVLTSCQGQPSAVTLDTRYAQPDSTLSSSVYSQFQRSRIEPSTSTFDLSTTKKVRAPYQPDSRFYYDSRIPTFLDEIPQRFGVSLSETVHLSPETLRMLLAAHQVFGNEYHNLGIAVSRLYEVLGVLKEGFEYQLDEVRDTARCIASITGEDDEYEVDIANDSDKRKNIHRGKQDDDDSAYRGGDEDEDIFPVVGMERVEMRLDRVHKRQQKLQDRYRELQGKMARLATKDWKQQERAWQEEVEAVERSLAGTVPRGHQPSQDDQAASDGGGGDGYIIEDRGPLLQRLVNVMQLCDEINTVTKRSPGTHDNQSKARETKNKTQAERDTDGHGDEDEDEDEDEDDEEDFREDDDSYVDARRTRTSSAGARSSSSQRSLRESTPKPLHQPLPSRAAAAPAAATPSSPAKTPSTPKLQSRTAPVPDHVRQRKMEEVQELLLRQKSIIASTASRLRTLALGSKV